MRNGAVYFYFALRCHLVAACSICQRHMYNVFVKDAAEDYKKKTAYLASGGGLDVKFLQEHSRERFSGDGFNTL